MADDSRSFVLALRPFSLVVSLATCSLGVSLAALDGYGHSRLAMLVVIAGFLLQSGANLINDYADLSKLYFTDSQRRSIVRNARLGAVAIAIACVIGVYLGVLRGWPLFMLGALGVIGALGYADGPINFKARGLGIVAVFFLTGVMMVGGAYYAMSGVFSLQVMWSSIPFSLFASLLLLANELRDFEQDREDGHMTFTVRFGYPRAAVLYRLLVLLIVLSTVGLAMRKDAMLLGMPLLLLGLLWQPLRLLSRGPQQRSSLARLTGRCYFIFATIFVAVLWVPQ